MINIEFDLKQKMAPAELERNADIVEKAIRTHLETKYGFDDFRRARDALRQVFKQHDIDESGTVSVKEFEKSLFFLNVVIPECVVKYLFERYDKDDSGCLNYAEFCEGIYGRCPVPAKDPNLRSIIERVKLAIFARGDGGMRGLSNTFRLFDKDRSGTLSKAEFKNGLQKYGVELSDGEFAVVMKNFDRNGKGGVNVTEFLTAMRGKMNDRRRRLVELAFTQLDKDKTGVAEFEELCSIYDCSQHPDVLAGRSSQEEVMKVFISSWDKDGDGTVTLPEFIDYYKDLSASIDLDDYFELMIRNAWHLAGGEGWCQNTSNLRVLVIHDDLSQEVVGIKDDLGLDKKDMRAIERALMRQGVQNIKKISLTM